MVLPWNYSEQNGGYSAKLCRMVYIAFIAELLKEIKYLLEFSSQDFHKALNVFLTTKSSAVYVAVIQGMFRYQLY